MNTIATKKCFIKAIKRLLNKILLDIKMRDLDRLYYMMFGNSFSLFAPSLYLKHSPEEIKKISARELAKLAELFCQIDD